MLKKLRVLFLGLVVLAGSACVTPTHASSAASVIITRIQAGGVSAPKEEFVVLYNTSAVGVDITDWCVINKSNVAFACFASQDEFGSESHHILAPHGYATIVSEEFAAKYERVNDFYSHIYEVTNKSSGSIISGGDQISLVNAEGVTEDVKAWNASLSPGKAWARLLLLKEPDIYATTNDTSDWLVESETVLPQSSVEVRLVEKTDENPEHPGSGSSDGPTNPSKSLLAPIITELLANPKGSDAGFEFIELHNPYEEELSLSGMSLRIGFDAPKWYSLPEVLLAPHEYRAFFNSELGFSLVNTMGKVQLFRGTTAVGEAIEYSSPKDDYAWALINSVWQYTSTATPGQPNSLPVDTADSIESETTLKPCASNQFRNPETGRCKLLSSSSTTQTPCKAGQERNPETNRCRSVVATTDTPAPCKEGQERNPETNRCRNIVKMAKAGYATESGDSANNQPSWYYWAALGGIVLSIVGYAVWEWREELAKVGARLRGLLTH